MYVYNCACDSCEAVGTCIVVPVGNFDEQTVLCADCCRIREELETEFGPEATEDEEEAFAEFMDWDSDEDDGYYDGE